MYSRTVYFKEILMNRVSMQVTRNMCIFFLILYLTGCVSTKTVGYGIVRKISQVEKVDYRPRTKTLKGAAIGAGVGAGAGASTGAVVGGVLGTGVAIATLGLGTLLIPGFVAGGAAVGAGVGAGAGAGVGAGAAYASELHEQGKGLYKISINMENSKNDIIIYQYIRKELPVKTRVQVLLKKDRLFIKENP